MDHIARTTLISGLLALFVVTGCNAQRSNEQIVADAQDKLARDQFRAVVIDMRNLLRDSPDNLEARLLLAQALVSTGDDDAADKEWQRARDLGASADQSLGLYAKILSLRNAHAELLAEVDPASVSDPGLASELDAMRARAMLNLGSVAEAEDSFKKVLAAGLSIEAQRISLLGVTQIASERGDLTSAERYARMAIELVPNSGPAVLSLARVLSAKRDYTQMVEVLSDERLSALRKNSSEYFQLVGERAAAQIALQDFDGAAASADKMTALAPKHPMTAYVHGQVAYQRGDLERALGQLQAVVASAPNYAPGLTLLGAVHLQRGDVLIAEEHLSRALALNPSNALARNFLAEARLRANRPEDAADALRQGLDPERGDPLTLAMLGRASMRSGKTDDGIAYFRRSLASQPNNLAVKLALINALVAVGDEATRREALSLINRLPDDAVNDSKRNALRVAAAFDVNNPAQGLAELERYLSASPADPLLLMLAGNLKYQVGKHDDARAHYEEALRVQPDTLNALYGILRVDQSTGDFSRSQALFEAARERAPDNVAPVLGLLRIASAQRRRQDMIKLAQAARALDETALTPNLTLAAAALAADKIDVAETFARSALNGNPGAARANAAMGVVQRRRGLYSEALANLRRAADLDPNDYYVLHELGRTHAADGSLDKATDSFAKALELNPTSFPVARSMLLANVRLGREDEAVALLEKIGRDFGAGPEFDRLAGEMRYEQKRWADALSAFAAAYAAQPDWPLAQLMHRSRVRLGAADADASLKDWLEKEPGHVPARLTLAQYYENIGRLPEAVAVYERMIDEGLDAPLVRNNLAWLYFKGGDETQVARAIELAESALSDVPGSPEIGDTLGWIQFNSGQIKASEQTLRAAMQNTTPKRSPEIAFHLATVLEARGTQNEAREILRSALTSSQAFPSRAQAQTLLASME